MTHIGNSALASTVNNKKRKLDVPKLCFRFIGLSEFEAREIESVIGDLVTSIKCFDDDRGCILVIAINSRSTPRFLEKYYCFKFGASVIQKLRVSLLTERDSYGCDVPKYASKIISTTGCGIEFSFTVI
jgi:hypothetical protein